jgi:hypothetical protein
VSNGTSGVMGWVTDIPPVMVPEARRRLLARSTVLTPRRARTAVVSVLGRDFNQEPPASFTRTAALGEHWNVND